MENFADRLIATILGKGSCVVVGLDPRLAYIPDTIKEKFKSFRISKLEFAARVILEFNVQIIDVITPYVGIVKPQIAFYELFGWRGIWAYAKTIQYARKKGLLVIGDIKRGDIPGTAEAYAEAHIGEVHIDGVTGSVLSTDAVTVNPYLGTDSLFPFIRIAKIYKKGIFVLVKTSNISSGDFQDIVCSNGRKFYEIVAEKTNEWGKNTMGRYGYSAIGAVVSAKASEEALTIRKLMPHSFFLVPGYGAQGGTARDIRHCFNPDGLGALISASRSIIYAWRDPSWEGKYGMNAWKEATEEAVVKMNEDVKGALIS